MGRELVTVLFTDIVGSTELRSTIGDDEADLVVGRHDAVVAEVVTAHSGRVIKFLGDGALATFSSAANATEAATAIQEQLAEGGPPVRIGLHAGDVDTSGGDVAGLPVAVASRLCGVAPEGGVVVSGTVRSLVGSRGGLSFESLGTPSLKGVADPIDAWLVATTEHREPTTERLPLPPLGRQVRHFIGRRDAVDILDSALATRDSQYLVAVSGEPGIGKTTLVGHWVSSVHRDGATVIVGSAPPEGVAPYQPFLEAVRPLLRLDRGIAPRGPGAANLALLLPELPTSSTTRPLLDDPNTERYLINEAFVEMLASAADRHGPLVLVLDDLHWADEASIVLLGHLLRHASDVPILIVGTYRDTDLDRRHPLADLLRDQRRARRAERLDLDGLAASDVASLVASVAGGSAPDAALDVILSETDGNPFFIEEIVEHLVAEGLVVDGAWMFDPTAAMTIPEGIRDTIGRRLDRLSNQAQDLLAAASVIGSTFDVDWLVAVAGGLSASVEDALDEALAAGFLLEGRGRDVSFSHALIRQTILDELSVLRRSRLHRSAGEALEGAGVSPDRLVHHWIGAREYARAMDASRRAMVDAEAVAAQSSVISHAETILELWDEVAPADRPSGLERHHAIVAAGLAIGIAQGSKESVEYLRAHRAELERLGDERGVGFVLAEEARHLWPLGQVEEAIGSVSQALELIPESPPSVERARAEAQLGRILMLNGSDDGGAASVTRHALDSARAARDPLTEAAALITLGVLIEDPDEAESTLRKGLEMATAQNAVFQITRARTNLSELLAQLGQHDEAIEIAEEGWEITKRYGTQGQSLGWMLVNLAKRHFDAGNWSTAYELQDTTAPSGYPEALQLLLRAEIQLHRGQFSEALATLDDLRTKYDHISDDQFQSPLAAAGLWLARWSGDLGPIPPDAYSRARHLSGRVLLSTNAAGLLFAAAEVAAWAERRGTSVADAATMDSLLSAAAEVSYPPFEALATTVEAQRDRYAGTDSPAAWAALATEWTVGTIQHAVVVLNWLRASDERTNALMDAVAMARTTVERLGMQPLLAEFNELLAD